MAVITLFQKLTTKTLNIGDVLRKLLLTFLLFSQQAFSASSEDMCKALTIYKEANTESIRGKRAVLDVIENRMQRQSKTACFVIKQPKQFSWHKRGMKLHATKEMLTTFYKVNNMEHVYKNAEFFHNTSVHPNWKGLRKVGKIGRHIFYERK